MSERQPPPGPDRIDDPQRGPEVGSRRLGMEAESGVAGVGGPGAHVTPEEEPRPPPPPLAGDATPEERDAHWLKYIYQGDRMPQLTIRAVAMGAFLGMGMSIAHIYTALKIGWGFGIAITACVLSFVMWNGL